MGQHDEDEDGPHSGARDFVRLLDAAKDPRRRGPAPDEAAPSSAAGAPPSGLLPGQRPAGPSSRRAPSLEPAPPSRAPGEAASRVAYVASRADPSPRGRNPFRSALGSHAGPPAPPPTLLRRFLRYFRPPRRLKFTREGKYYLGITLGVGFAAINTGNNLLYLLLGMLLSLMLVSGVMSELSLNKLTVTRRLPARAQVGRPHLVEIEVYNHKKRVPSYAIEVEDLRAGQPADKRCFFLKISPASAQVAAYRRTPARRGRDRHTGFRIATRFPFGLFEKSREVSAEDELIIYPAVDPVRLPQEEAGRRDGGVGANGRGGGDETYSLRHKREGDDPRDIYWRKSTMQNQLILRERARETRPDVELVIDTVRPGGADDGFGPLFEKRIRDVASRAVAHIKRGDGVVVATTLGERTRGDRNYGSDPILRFLALLEAIDEAVVMRVREERASEASPRPRPARAEAKAAAPGRGAAEAAALRAALAGGKPT